MKRLSLGIATLVIALAPLAGHAHSPNDNADCSGLPNEAEVLVQDPASQGIGLYVDTEQNNPNSAVVPGVWTEGNGFDGLQTHAHVCTDKTTDEVKTVPADTRAL